jgi:uncharacterized protein (DUF2225 family)
MTHLIAAFASDFEKIETAEEKEVNQQGISTEDLSNSVDDVTVECYHCGMVVKPLSKLNRH